MSAFFKDISSETANTVHNVLLAGMLDPHACTQPTTPDNRWIAIVDQNEDTPRLPAKTQRVRLGFGAQPSIEMDQAQGLTLTYDRRDIGTARDALLAVANPLGAPIAADSAMLALLTLARKVARSDVPVLIGGPTGTGKEVLARFLHTSSKRAAGPFIAINCAAMPEAMLEAMLFGHRKGAFTGASEAQEGFFRAANGGTLLLDEVGEMPIALQAKLLRALQEGEVTPIGATKPVKTDVRILAATNRDLSVEIKEGRFREDLYYRLSVFPLHIPALRERPADIAPLAFGMMVKFGSGDGEPGWIAPSALAMLRAHPWPGNVRELENVMRRALLLACGEGCIRKEHIRFDAPARSLETVASIAPDHASRDGEETLSTIAFRSEADAILRALEQCDGNRRETAKMLDISERTLRYRLANMRDSGMPIRSAQR